MLHGTQLKIFIKAIYLFLQIWEIKFYCFKDSHVLKYMGLQRLGFHFLNEFFCKYSFLLGKGIRVFLEVIKEGLLIEVPMYYVFQLLRKRCSKCFFTRNCSCGSYIAVFFHAGIGPCVLVDIDQIYKNIEALMVTESLVKVKRCQSCISLYSLHV